MPAFDDLAFNLPPSRSRALLRDYCVQCEEIVTLVTRDRQRCHACNTELQRRPDDDYDTHTNDPPLEIIDFNQEPEMREIITELIREGTITAEMRTNERQPASEQAISKLKRFSADAASTVEVAITTSGIKGEVVAIPANFGPHKSVPNAIVEIGDPLDGAAPFENAGKLQDKIVLLERGGCTFVQKSLRAQEAGAVAVIINQTMHVWPYTMTDSKKESKDLDIPVYMISRQHGRGFLDYLRTHSDQEVTAHITVRDQGHECVICQVGLEIGMDVMRMPCQHLFHANCLLEWLKIGNSCPICRVEIESEDDLGRPRPTAQARGDFQWSEWFS